MTEIDLEAGLRSLRQSLNQIKAFLAWEQLKQAEAKPGIPPAFKIYDPTETDLRNEYSLFLSTSVQIHSILDDSTVDIPEEKREAIRRQLAKTEQQAHSLNLHHRLCVH